MVTSCSRSHIMSVLHDSTEGFPPSFCSCSEILTCWLSQHPMSDFKVKFRLYRWELLCAFAGCVLPSTHSESMIPDQGKHLEHPYSKTHHYPFPIIVCLLLLPRSLPWLHCIEIPLLRVPCLNLCDRQLPLVFRRFVQRDGEVGRWCQI